MYILYIDESGDTIPLSQKGKKFLVLTGCIIHEDNIVEIESKLRSIKTKYFQNPEFVNLALELTGGSPVFILPLLEGLIYAYESGIRTGDLTKLDKEIGIAAKISTADSEVQHTLEKIVAIKKTLENPQVQAFMRQNQNFPFLALRIIIWIPLKGLLKSFAIA